MRTISAAASGVPSSKFVGSRLFKNLSMCWSMTPTSSRPLPVQWRSLRGQGCGKCCPGFWFFGLQRSLVGRSWLSFTASLSGVGLPPVSTCPSILAAQPALHQSVQWPQCRQPLGPGSAASTTPLAMRLTSFAGGGEHFVAVCFSAAHCILIRAISCSSVSTATSE